MQAETVAIDEDVVTDNINEDASSDVTQDSDLDTLVRHHIWTAMGVGLVPIPVVDFVAVSGVQINMLAKIAQHYDVPFAQDRVKSILASLVGASLPATLSQSAASMIKIIPLIGQSLGAVSMSLIAGASTYAIAQVFIRHFASGGTFLTFDAAKAKAYYTEMYEKGRSVAANMRSSKSNDVSAENDTEVAPAAEAVAAEVEEPKTTTTRKKRTGSATS